MKSNLSENFIAQLNIVIDSYKELRRQARGDDLLGVPDSAIHRIITLARASIERASGTGSPYFKQAESILAKDYWDGGKADMIIGVVESLRMDLQAGYLKTLEELIHGEVFGDFLEMASYLLEEGYKDAAAVIAGSALEVHLRQLCQKNGIDTQEKGRPRKADQLNAELARSSVYSRLDQKNVTAWLDLRNKAAHGHYDEYSKEQVSLMVSGIRDFITRNPA